MDDDAELNPEAIEPVVARYRALSAYLTGVIGSLADDETGWGFGVDHLRVEAQYRWLAEVRELQRERSALEDLIIARARRSLPYPSVSE